MRKSVVWTVVGLCLLIAAGCRHPVGFTDVSARIVPTSEDARVTQQPLDEPLQLVKDITPDNAVIELRVEALSVTSGPAVRETYGRAVWVPYRWYAALVKPVVTLTIVTPFILAFYEPHQHGLEEWGADDYFRDVAAWWNPVSAMPMSPRAMDKESRLLTVEDMVVPTAERRVPLPGRQVVLSLDDRRIGEAVSDSAGLVRFDLSGPLASGLGTADHVMRFSVVQGPEETIDFTLPLKGETVRQYRQKRTSNP